MNDRFFALLVYDQPAPLESLRQALRDLKVETCSVHTCEEAKRLIPQTQPHMVFTDTSLPDGSWVDLVSAAEESSSPVNVIVVGANKDVKFYLSAIERGAYDFLLPPFEHKALDFVVHSAGDNVRLRRQAQAYAATA